MSNMEKHLFNLKFAAKELQRNAKKCDKEEKAEKAKVKQVGVSNWGFARDEDPGASWATVQSYSVLCTFYFVSQAVQKGNMEAARIHAENAIRQKHQSINFLRMSARVDAVSSRVQTAVTMNQVSKSMSGVVKSMDATLKSMNLEKISALMDKFESQFETLDVQTAQMEDTMGKTTTLTTPQVTSTPLSQQGKASVFKHRIFLKFLFACLLVRAKLMYCCMRWLTKQGWILT
uniref:Charged multivesicular body protein 1b-2-like n=1 Tax=Mastacembelus armatus TaxID=205130 RepID=A0A3Q3MLL1_9TELE